MIHELVKTAKVNGLNPVVKREEENVMEEGNLLVDPQVSLRVMTLWG